MGNMEKDDSDFLIDLLFETSMPLSEIARELETSVPDLKKQIDQLGLSWILESKKKMSRGQSALSAIMQKILVGEKIVNEYGIADGMRLDVYCPKYQIAAEYHGRQHFFYTSRFFESKYEFEQAQLRDTKKAQYCRDNGIALIVFRYNDLLTEDVVYNRMLEAIRETGYVPKVPAKKSRTSSPYYKEMKKKNSEYKKILYRRMKDSKTNDSR
jgi:hypothetical protein